MTDATERAIEFARRWRDGQTTLDPARVDHVPLAQALRSITELVDTLSEESQRAVDRLHDLHAAHEERQLTIATVLDEIVLRLWRDHDRSVRGQPPQDADALIALAKIAKELRLQAEDQLHLPRID